MTFFERLKSGLSKTRENFTDRIGDLVGLSASIDDDFLDELEIILLASHEAQLSACFMASWKASSPSPQ